jgi:hypothetical protein
MQDDDIFDGKYRAEVFDSRRAEDLGVAIGALIPASDGARVRRVGHAAATVVETVKAQDGIEQEITARSRSIAARQQARRNQYRLIQDPISRCASRIRFSPRLRGMLLSY